jgi:hypothetical protein
MSKHNDAGATPAAKTTVDGAELMQLAQRRSVCVNTLAASIRAKYTAAALMFRAHVEACEACSAEYPETHCAAVNCRAGEDLQCVKDHYAIELG